MECMANWFKWEWSLSMKVGQKLTKWLRAKFCEKDQRSCSKRICTQNESYFKPSWPLKVKLEVKS